MREKNSIYANLCKNPEQQNRVTHKLLLGKKNRCFFPEFREKKKILFWILRWHVNSGRKKNGTFG